MAGRGAVRTYPGEDRVLPSPGIERSLPAGRGEEEHIAAHPVRRQVEGRKQRRPVSRRVYTEPIFPGCRGAKEEQPLGIGDGACDLRRVGREQDGAPTTDGNPGHAVHDLAADDLRVDGTRQEEVYRHERSAGVQGANSRRDRKSTRLNSSHTVISYAVFCLKKKKKKTDNTNICETTRSSKTIA